MSKNQAKTLRMVELALLAAIIILLQQIVIPLPGGLTLSLVLIPIVVGAVLFGPASGALLGGVFGVVVTLLVITGRA
ncbi:MAG: ECF transporter S component, partial [Clostridia bacterium]|nr:ECF transporter S component [Clostridia bacterium]